MPLTPESDSGAVFLTIKHYKFWREIKKPVEGCKSIEVTNPATKQIITKYGYHYNDVEGYVIGLESYKREFAGKKFAGFKLKMSDGAETFYVDMPWRSVLLRKFMKVMDNVNFELPLKMAAWKSKEKNKKGNDETAIWFTQNGVTVPFYFTKEHPNGLPQAKKDHRDEWDFRDQEAWLADRILNDIVPRITKASKHVPNPNTLDPPAEPDLEEGPENDFNGVDDLPF